MVVLLVIEVVIICVESDFSQSVSMIARATPQSNDPTIKPLIAAGQRDEVLHLTLFHHSNKQTNVFF